MATLTDFYPTAGIELTDTYSSQMLDYVLTNIPGEDFTLAPNDAPCALSRTMDAYMEGGYTVGGSDSKIFDKRNCSIVSIAYFDDTTQQPYNPPYGEGRTVNYEWLNFDYCGRIGVDAQLITPVDNESTIDITVTGHGLPLNLYGGEVVVSAGDYSGSLLTSRGEFIIDSIIDANTIRLTTTLANWNIQIAKGSPQNIYFGNPVIELMGGQAQTGSRYHIHWKFDRTAPDFLDSVHSDD